MFQFHVLRPDAFSRVSTRTAPPRRRRTRPTRRRGARGVRPPRCPPAGGTWARRCRCRHLRHPGTGLSLSLRRFLKARRERLKNRELRTKAQRSGRDGGGDGGHETSGDGGGDGVGNSRHSGGWWGRKDHWGRGGRCVGVTCVRTIDDDVGGTHMAKPLPSSSCT